jgi:hypothetical protein
MNTVIDKVAFKFAELDIKNSNLKLETIPLNKLQTNKNYARMSGLDKNCIVELANLIKNNKYDLNNFISPIVEQNDDGDGYTIISGHHRYKAHILAKQKEMVCVVATFSSDSDRNAWRVHENSPYNENYVKNISDDKDHVNIIVSLLKDKNSGIEPNRESIDNFIVRTKITVNNITKTKLINSILKKVGVIDHDYIETLETKDFESHVDNISLEIPDVKFISSIFGPTKQDYGTRTFSKLSHAFIENPTQKICVPYSISGATNSDKLIEHRTKVKLEMEKLLAMSHKIVQLENEGYNFMDLIDFVPLPQLGNEIKNEKDGGLNKCFEKIKKSYSKKTTKKKSVKNISNDAIIELCTIELRKKMESDPIYKEKLVNQFFNEND